MTDAPPPGYYRASDGQLYPVPPGYYLASDGQLYPLTPPAAPTMAPPGAAAIQDGWRWTAGPIVTVAGAGGAALGSFLPWASAGPFSVSGTDGGDGVLTLILAIAAGVLAAAGARTGKIGFPIGALVAGVLIALIAAVDMADIAEVADQPFIDVEIGGGLVLTLLGGGVAVVGAIIALVRR